MSLRTLMLVALILLMAGFVALNFEAIVQPNTLNLGFSEIQAPLGLVMLGMMWLMVMVLVRIRLRVMRMIMMWLGCRCWMWLCVRFWMPVRLICLVLSGPRLCLR